MAAKLVLAALISTLLAFSSGTVIESQEEVVSTPPEQTGTAIYTETGNANLYLDQLVANLGPLIAEKNLDPLRLPNLKKGFEKMMGLIKIHGGFQMTQNVMLGLKTLHRAGDATLRFEDNVMKIQATIGIENLKVGGHAMAWWGAIRKKFTAAGSVDYVSATVALEMPMAEGGKPKATMFEINKIGKVKLNVKDLGALNWVVNEMGSLFINMVKNLFKNMLSSPLLKLINGSLEKLPIFQTKYLA